MIQVLFMADQTKSLPLRSEIPEQDRWDLTPLYPSSEQWEQSFADYRERFPRITTFKGRLAQGSRTVLECLEFEKELALVAERLGQYASLQCSEDSSNPEFLERQGRLINAYSQAAEVASFVEPELQEIPDDEYAALLTDPLLAEWHIYLSKIRRHKPHTLSADGERLMALAGAALDGPDDIFGQLTNVDMKFDVVTDETGAKVELSHGGYSSFLQKRDRKVRSEAFHTYYREFNDHKFSLAAALSSSVKVDVFRARARNHESAIEAALFPDNVPVSVYDALISEVRANLPSLHKYYELRRKWLALPDIHFYDTYLPVVAEVESKTTFHRAAEMVLEAVRPLGEAYVSVLADGFSSRWVDRYESKGKRSGAFSSSSYGNPPYILMNYKEDVFSDIYTLAHEAGHSMHSHLSQNARLFQDARYPIFLAEVASTFNEGLLTHHLLSETSDPKMRAFILNRQIDDIRGTLFRQTMFAEFEKTIHAMEEAGEALTLESFRAAYKELLDAYFGPDFIIDEELSLECLRIPHFYSAFYVYKYATGISAAIALSNGVLQDPAANTARYLEFLSMGGSKYPLDALKAAGVDMAGPEPVRAAITLFNQRVDELAELLA